jgi:hypothetical protein
MTPVWIENHLDRSSHHFRAATMDQTASTNPNGQAPCRKPYAEPNAHATANPRMNHELRFSNA